MWRENSAEGRWRWGREGDGDGQGAAARLLALCPVAVVLEVGAEAGECLLRWEGAENSSGVSRAQSTARLLKLRTKEEL